jgi:hypothetical protein
VAIGFLRSRRVSAMKQAGIPGDITQNG